MLCDSVISLWFDHTQLQSIVEITHRDDGNKFEDEETGLVYDEEVLKMFWY